MDGLRGIFAISVLLFHALPFPEEVGRLVRFFFVLSSFLLTLILLRDRATGPLAELGFWRVAGRFWRKRAVRVMPAYFVVLAIVTLLDMPEVRATFLWHLSFLSNVLFATSDSWQPYPVAHFWTIAVEEQFYLVWPFVILLAGRVWLPRILIMMVVGAVAWKAVAAASGAGSPTLFAATWASMDGFAVGAAVALVMASGTCPLMALRRWLGAASLAVAALTILCALEIGPHGPVYRHAVLDTLQLLPVVWALVVILTGSPAAIGRILASRPLVYLGRISYGVYLFHLPILFAFSMAGAPLAVVLFGGAVVTIAAAALSDAFVETPARRLRPAALDRTGVSPPAAAPQRSGQAAPAGTPERSLER